MYSQRRHGDFWTLVHALKGEVVDVFQLSHIERVISLVEARRYKYSFCEAEVFLAAPALYCPQKFVEGK
jgi:hypothetical protein